MTGTGIDVKLRLSDIVDTAYDIQIGTDGDVVTEDSFDTAIVVSLFTDARALPSQVALPERRRGWIGNERTPGKQMGGILWLFEQQRLNRKTANEIEDAAQQALQWMIDEQYAIAVSAVASIKSATTLTLEILVTKPSGEVESRLFNLWEGTGQTFLAEEAA